MKLISLALFFCLVPLALGLGISQPFFENNTIYLEQGSYYEHRINVQNALPISFPVEFGVSGDYLTVGGGKKTVLSLPAQTTDYTVPIAIAIPDEAPVGLQVDASYWVQVISDGSGTVPMTPRLSDSFTLIITPKPTPAEHARTWLPVFIGVALLLTVILLVVWYVRSRSRQHKLVTGADSFSHAKSIESIIARIAEMDDDELQSQISKGTFARAVHRFDKDPERYHRLRIAKNRRDLIRALRSSK